MIVERPEGNKLTGLYRGKVIQHLPHGRLKVYIPAVYAAEWETHPEMLPSAEQLTPLFAGSNQGNGVFSYPNIGSIVMCQFINGDQNYPLVIGATLGGPNAFGQYDQIFENNYKTSSYLSSSPRHIITAGKSHIEFYEKGILSGIVVDPDRRETNVDFDKKIHSISSKSKVIERPVADLVNKEELSNIWSRYVFDNDGGTHGYSYLNTHWLDLCNINDTSAQYSKNTNITTDIQHKMQNDGKISELLLSTGVFSEKNNKEKTNINRNFILKNESLTEIPNKIQLSSFADIKSNEVYIADNLTSNVILKNSNVISEELSGKILLSAYLDSHVTKLQNSNIYDTAITCNNHISEHPEGKLEFISEHTTLQNDYVNGKNNNKLQTGKCKSIKNIELGHKNSSSLELITVSDNNTTIITNNLTADFNSNKDFGGNNIITNYKYADTENKLIIDSKLTSDIIAGKDSTYSNINLTQLKTINGSELINSEVIDQMNTNTSKIEKRVTNKLASNACENSIIMDAGTGVMDIKIIDNVGGTKCTFKLDKSGILTISTDMQVKIETNKTILNSPGGVNITGNTIINGTLKTTGNITSGGVVKDTGCTLATHIHPCGTGSTGSPKAKS